MCRNRNRGHVVNKSSRLRDLASGEATCASANWTPFRRRNSLAFELLDARVLFSAAPTSIALTASSSSSTYGQSITLTAAVSSTVSPSEGTVTFNIGSTALGSAPVIGGTAQVAVTTLPAGQDTITAVYSDLSGNYAGSSTMIGPSSIIKTVAGGSTVGYNGDNIQATSATLYYPDGVATDVAGNLYIIDSANNRIREVNHSTGVITTVAGNGTNGYSGDNGPATAAGIANPHAIALDSAGDLFIADTGNQRIREVNHATGIISTVAGNGTRGFIDNTAATAAELYLPEGIAVDAAGNLYISDTDNDRVREVNASTHTITTIVGSGNYGSNGDGGLAAAAQLSEPEGVALDAAGDLFIADYGNNRVRAVDHATNIITTVAGNGNTGSTGDNGPATAASIYAPISLAVDTAGDVFIDQPNVNTIREVNATTHVITTVVGTGTVGFAGDNGPAAAAMLNFPNGVAVDTSSNLYIADYYNSRVREVFSGVAATTIAKAAPSVLASDFGGTYTGSAFSAAAIVNGSSSLESVSPTVTYYSGSSPTGTPLSGVPTNAGTYTVVASFAGSTDYAAAQSIPVTFTISPVSLTITANSANKVYGAPLPTFTASYSGFVGSDTAASLTTQPSFTSTATAASHVTGIPYMITASAPWTRTTPLAIRLVR